MNDPRVMRPPERGGWGFDAAWADDFHHALRVLLTGDRDGYYADFGSMAELAQGLPPPLRATTAATRAAARAASARRPRTGPPDSSSSARRTTTRSATGPSATACRAAARPAGRALHRCSRRSRRCSSWARSTARAAPFQFFTDHIDKKIADAPRARPAARVRGVRRVRAPRCPTRRTRHVRALEADAPRATRRSSRALRRAARALRRRAAAGRGRRRSPSTRTARWLRVRRGGFEIVCNFADEPRRVPCAAARGRPRDALGRAAGGRRARGACRRSPGALIR